MSKDDGSKPVVLIADDDELMQLMLSEAAAAAGFETVVAADGDEAMAIAGKRPLDIVLLDVNMPKLDGFACCDALRKMREHHLTPIVMVTGDDDTDSINNAFQRGATDFISKPINWSLLAHRLRYILRGSDNLKELHARERKIHKLAYFDDLTGLPNRALLREKTTQMLADASSGGNDVALLYLDMDSFKRINDSFGHGVGDNMLAAVAKRLRKALDSITGPLDCTSVLARVGGDEFIATISTGSAMSIARSIASEWIECLDRPFMHDGNELHMTPSIGIAAAPDHGDDFDGLMKNASTAMYVSKRNSLGHCEEFCDSMYIESLQRVQLESALRDALRNDRLDIHFQPIYSVETGEIAKLEALLRWHDESRGQISPLTIVALAEESGLILDVNRWVVDTVCRRVAAWHDDGLSVPVAVNISAAEFLHGDPVALVVDACERHEIEASLIEVEITESTLLHDVERAISILRRLKSSGVRVSVDDFGTGYSSLAYLKRFDIDTLKIDRSFVTELGSNVDDRAICDAVLALAKSLSLDVVAEGVETFEQHSWLATHRCDYVQGFLWSTPLPAEELHGLLVESSQSATAERKALGS